MLLVHQPQRSLLQTRRSSAGLAHRRARLLVSRTASPSLVAEPAVTQANRAADIVDEVLRRIDGTDRGAAISPTDRAKVDALIGELEDIGRTQQPQPLDNELLYHHFTVEYVSRGAQQKGEPAGGRFRRGLGRYLFSTTGLYQSVIAPDIATNKVSFKLLGLVRGYVGLRGKVEPIDKATVKVNFEPAVLNLAGLVTLRLGSSSWVQLTTTYLDERVRLGRGSLGSLFVFKRGREADDAGMDQVGREANLVQASPAQLLLAYLAALGACAAAFLTWQPLLQGLAVVGGLLATGLARVLWAGGQVQGRAKRQEDAARDAELRRTQEAVAAATASGPS